MAPFPPPSPETLDACIEEFRRQKHPIGVFGDSVRKFFDSHPELTTGTFPIIHSVRSRLKDEGHLRAKITKKKVDDNRDITAANLLDEVNDLFGVRVLHLHMEQFKKIHSAIIEYATNGHWTFHEPPKAYTWDPESRTFFEGMNIKCTMKESHYTSVHYVVRPNQNSKICCEIQVRTLFEEAWGEIDHTINYPDQTEDISCREQLKVLAKVVGASTRLASSIFRTYEDKH